MMTSSIAIIGCIFTVWLAVRIIATICDPRVRKLMRDNPRVFFLAVLFAILKPLGIKYPGKTQPDLEDLEE